MKKASKPKQKTKTSVKSKAGYGASKITKNPYKNKKKY